MHFKEFNDYCNLDPSLSEELQIGGYVPGAFRTESEKISIDFYRISLKINFDAKDYNRSDEFKGLIFFNTPHIPFDWKSDSPWSGFFVQFTKSWLELHPHLKKSFLFYGLHEGIFINEVDLNEMLSVFNKLNLLYNNSEFDSPLFDAYLNLLFELVAHLLKKQFVYDSLAYNSLVEEFFLLLKQYDFNPNSPVLNVGYFAKKLSVSNSYLGDVIKHFSGSSPSDLIAAHTVSYAKKLLKDSVYSISEISTILGFNYATYFARFFKQHTGVTPKEFRRG